jgi:hypothetical protein
MGCERSCGAKKRLRININAKASGKIELFDSLVFRGQHLISGYDEKLILLIENEIDTVKVKLNSDDKSLRKYTFGYEWKEDTDYSLCVFPGAFLDVFGLQNDTIKTSFKTPTWNKYADVNLTVELPGDCISGLIQLLTQQQKILQENGISKDGVITYKHLHPGKYMVKMIYDNNENGLWDTGSLLDKRQAEKIIYYSGVIEVRSGWDVDITWKVED